MECKKALEEAANDIEKAVDILKQKGVVKAAKKADRDTTEGRIGVALSSDRKKLAYVKLGCETDFVAKNSEFVALAEKVAKVALDKNASSTDALLAEKAEGGTVDEVVKAAIAKIGENIKVNDVAIVTADKGILEVYSHLGSKLVVIVEIQGDESKKETLINLAHELALQIAMDNPEFVCRDQVPSDIVAREKENLMAPLRTSSPSQKVSEPKSSRESSAHSLKHAAFSTSRISGNRRRKSQKSSPTQQKKSVQKSTSFVSREYLSESR